MKDNLWSVSSLGVARYPYDSYKIVTIIFSILARFGFPKIVHFLTLRKGFAQIEERKKNDRSLSSFGRNYDLNLKRSMAIEKKSPLIVCAR